MFLEKFLEFLFKKLKIFVFLKQKY